LAEDAPQRSQLRDTFTILVSSGVSQGFIAVLYLLAARHVGPTAFGSALVILSVGNFLSTIVDFGQNSFLLRELAASRVKSQQVVHQIFSKNIVVMLVASFFGLIVYASSSNAMLSATSWLYVVLLSLETTAQSILRWTGGAGKFSLSIVCDKGASVLIYVLVLAANFKSEIWIPVALTVGSLVGLLVAIFLHPGKLRLRTESFSAREAVRYITSAKSFGFYGFAIALQGLDTLALRLVAGPEATGIYAAVSRWIMPLTLIAGAYSAATYPRFAAAKDDSSARVLLRSGIKFWIGSLFLVACVIAAAPWLVSTLLGVEYSKSVITLRVLSAAMVFAIANQPLAVFLQARGQEKQVAWSVGGGIMLQILLTLALGYFLGAVGGAYAWLFGQVIIFTLLAGNLRKLR